MHSVLPGFSGTVRARPASLTCRQLTPDLLVLSALRWQRRLLRSITALNQRAPNAKHWAISPGILSQEFLDDKNHFSCVGEFLSSGCFRAARDARWYFIATANSFKYDARHSSGCRSAAPASPIPYRDSEGVATASERSAGRVGKGKPHGRVGPATKSRAFSHYGSGKFACARHQRPAAISN